MNARTAKLFAIAPLVLTVACELFRQPEAESPPPAVVEPEPEPLTMPPPPEPEPSADANAAPPPEPAEPAIQPTPEPTRGRLGKAAIQRGIEPGLPAFQACYERTLAQRPTLQGTILVNFTIAPDGTVPYAAALKEGTDLPDDRVIDCVLDEFQKLKFDAPSGGRVVSTYPLRFAPKSAEEPASPP